MVGLVSLLCHSSVSVGKHATRDTIVENCALAVSNSISYLTFIFFGLAELVHTSSYLGPILKLLHKVQYPSIASGGSSQLPR